MQFFYLFVIGGQRLKITETESQCNWLNLYLQRGGIEQPSSALITPTFIDQELRRLHLLLV